MITKIGIVSGEILNFIDQKKRPVSLAEVRSQLNNEEGLTDMGIGWLVREGHVQLLNKGHEKYLCAGLCESRQNEQARALP